jgi:hypothetical protein
MILDSSSTRVQVAYTGRNGLVVPTLGYMSTTTKQFIRRNKARDDAVKLAISSAVLPYVYTTKFSCSRAPAL